MPTRLDELGVMKGDNWHATCKENHEKLFSLYYEYSNVLFSLMNELFLRHAKLCIEWKKSFTKSQMNGRCSFTQIIMTKLKITGRNQSRARAGSSVLSIEPCGFYQAPVYSAEVLMLYIVALMPIN